MANYYWVGNSGGTGTDYEVGANWTQTSGGSAHSSAPSDGDNLYFDSTASYDCKISDARQVNAVTIENNFDQLFWFDNSSAALTCDSIMVKATGKIKASAASKIKFIGTGVTEADPARNIYVLFQHADFATNDLGMFDSATSRSNMTFDFSGVSNGVKIVLENGVYPNMDFSGNSNTATFRPAAQSTQNMINTYGITSMLNFKTDNKCNVKNEYQAAADYDKIFKINGKIEAACEKFFWGNTTLHIWPQGTDDPFPSSGNYHATGSTNRFGATNASSVKVFETQYEKLVIEPNGTNNANYYLMDSASILSCNELVIKAGGRLYGPDEQSRQGAEIQCITRPTIDGDWNFTQLSDGIYRSRTHGPALNYYHGGTGLNTLGTSGQVLAVHSDGDRLEWSSSAGGGTDTTFTLTGDSGSNQTIAHGNTLDIAGGDGIATVVGATDTVTVGLDIDGMTDIGEALVAADLMIVDNGAGGTNRKATMTRLQTYMQNSLTFTTNTDVDVSVANLKTRLAGGFGSNAVTIGDSDDVVTIGNDLIVTGDFTVSGDTTTQNVATISVEDPLIELARNQSNSADALDIGFFGKYGVGGTHKYAGLFRDANDSGKWKLFKDTQEDLTSATTINTGGTGYTTGTLVANLEGSASTAVVASTITLADESSDTTCFPLFSTDATGNRAAKTGSNLTFNSSSGILTATGFAGDITGDVTGDVTGNADTATALETARNIGGVSFNGTASIDLPGVNTAGNQNTSGTAATATVATTVTITDNENTDEDNALIFTAGGDVDGGNLGLESDGTLTYNPSTGKVTATGFIGALTGDVTGNVSGSSATTTTATNATNITLADESSDTSCYVVFATGASGNLPPKTGSNLTFDSDTGILTAGGGFAGNVSGSSGSCTGNAATATLASSCTISENNSNNETVYPVFVDGATGSQGLESDTGLNYNPNTGVLTSTSFTGNLTGNVTGTLTPTAPFDISHSVTNPALDGSGGDAFAQTIDIDLSGSGATGGDREQGGLYIDLDTSTTGGDTGDEHRPYGIWVDGRQNSAADADAFYGVYSYTESQRSSASTTATTNQAGVYGYATSDETADNTVTNLQGVRGDFSLQDNGVVSNSFGLRAHGAVYKNRNANLGAINGVAAEVQIDGGRTSGSSGSDTDITTGNISVYKAVFDHNVPSSGESTVSVTNSYLYYGNSSLTDSGQVTNNFGVYMTGEAKNYFSASVGIGTTNPKNTLQINHSAGDGNQGILIVRDDATTTDPELLGAIGFDSKDGNVPSSVLEASAGIAAYAAEAHSTGDKGGDLVFFTTAIDDNDDTTSHERMRIDSEGKVGIGTTAPEALLDVNTGSDIAIQMGADVNAATLTNDTRKYGRFATPHYHNAEEPIGLIVGDSDGTDNIVNVGGGSSAVNAATSIRFWSAANDATVTGTERMRIDSAGKVGIGTTIPQTPLHVIGNVMITNTDSDDTAKDSRILGRTYTNNDYNLIYGYADSTTNRLYLGGGTGTGEPATDIRFFTAALNAGTDATGTERMRIASDGKVGIGEDDPASMLEIRGATTIGTTTGHIMLTGDSATDGQGPQIVFSESGSGSSYAGAYIGHARTGSNSMGDLIFATRATGGDANTVPTERMRILANGDVGVGTASPGHKLEVSGSFAATTKSFDIEHPTKEGMRLLHGSLEGPEHGVYIRGKNTTNTIELPDYWLGLVDEDTITVQLTSIGKPRQLYVRSIKDNTINIGSKPHDNLNYYYFIQAERKDVEKMEVEY